MRPRHVAVLVLLAILTATPSASARAAPTAIATAIARDCAAHRGALTGVYEARSLARTYDSMTAAADQFQDCGQAVASRLAGLAAPTRSPAKAIIGDCLEHGGRLTRSYRTTQLQNAFVGLTDRQRTDTRCGIGIASQANGRTGIRLVPASRRRVVKTGSLTTAQTIARLADEYPAFARAPGPDDIAPGAITTLAGRSSASAHPGQQSFDLAQTRLLGTDQMPMWVLPGRGEACWGVPVADNFIAGCGPVESIVDQLAAGLAFAPGGVLLWAAVPKSASTIRVLDHHGSWHPVHPTNSLMYSTFAKVPRMLTWRDHRGQTHYEDYTAVRCMPGQPCPKD